MIKLILFVKRKSGTTVQEFREHYETVHVPLAEKSLGQWFVGYKRNYLNGLPGGTEALYDCVTELYYGDRQALEASVAWARSEDGQVLTRDEATFMDHSSMHVCLVDEVSSAL